jgi:hypothetical protein
LQTSYTYGDTGIVAATSGGLGGGVVSYRIASGDAASVDAKTGTITILKAGSFRVRANIAESAFYEGGYALSREVTVTPASPEIAQLPEASSILAGQQLSDSALQGGKAVFGDTAVQGSFAWSNGSEVVSEPGSYEAVFTPDASYGGNFKAVALRIAVTLHDDLAGEVDKAEEIIYGGVGETPAWEAFVDAKGKAEAVLANRYSTQQEVDKAAKALSTAVAALKTDDDSNWFDEGVSRYVTGSTRSLVHVAAHDWALHTGVVKVDGNVLELGKHYTSESGSTVTTLLPSYLDTLAPGEHTLIVEFSQGISDIFSMFTIEAKGGGNASASGKSPATGASIMPLGTAGEIEETDASISGDGSKATAQDDTKGNNAEAEGEAKAAPVALNLVIALAVLLVIAGLAALVVSRRRKMAGAGRR